MSEKNIYQLLRDNKELTSLPQVLAEVIRITEDENCTADQLATIILKDPALSARMLRVVNSPFYGPMREITTVNQAIMTMGLRAVKAMALSAGLYNMFQSSDAVLDRSRFWRHSLEVAITCREVAKACSYQPSEEAFIAGLLHDVGILVLETNFRKNFRRIWKLVEAGESLTTLEEAEWGTNHARLGKFLLDQWKLPSLFGEAICSHHEVFAHDQDLPRNRLGRIVNLANKLSKFRIIQSPPLDTDELTSVDLIAKSLNIGPTVLTDIQEKTLSALLKESEYLEIEIGSPIDLLEAANNLIYRQFILVESVLKENRKMQAQIAKDQVKQAALESLKTITATLAHYINNASATILGRAQLVELGAKKGTIADPENTAKNSMEIIIKAVETITLVLEELKKLTEFDTTKYHDDTSILNIEGKLKEAFAELDERRKALSADD
jgi:HD-like signal output (HDOD) protein